MTRILGVVCAVIAIASIQSGLLMIGLGIVRSGPPSFIRVFAVLCLIGMSVAVIATVLHFTLMV